MVAGALHVDAAAEVRAFGDRHARRDDVAVHRAVVADVDLLRRRHIADDFAEHDHRLGEYLSLDLAVGPDGQHVLAQLDAPFDVSFDRQILAATQFTFDDDRLADIHLVPLNLGAHSLSLRRRGAGAVLPQSRRRRRCRRRASA